MNLNPNIPLKFALGIMQLGFGYLLLQVGAAMAGESAQVPLMILVFMYMLHTTGELFLSPIGLSMVTKLAPKHMTGSVMGAWFLSFAFANSLAAFFAQFTGGEGGGGPLSSMVKQATGIVTPPPGALTGLIGTTQELVTNDYWVKLAESAQESLQGYLDPFTTMGLISVGIGVFLALISPLLNKMMHGAK